MKKTSLLFVFIASFFASVCAQDTVTNTYFNYNRAWSLQIGVSEGYGIYRDMGTAPLSFKGLLIQPTLGLHFVYPKRMEFSIVTRSTIGVFEDAVKPTLNFNAFDISNLLRFKFIKAVRPNSSVREGKTDFEILPYWGVALTNFLDVTVNPSYENATAGISDFFGPEAIGRIDMDPHWSAPVLFHAEMGIMPVAAVLRPGYSYIDNYTASHPVLNTLFDDFELKLKPFAAVTTDVGIDIVTGSASRICFSYLWTYHTSGNSGQHRYDHASHLLAIDFIVKLRAVNTNR